MSAPTATSEPLPSTVSRTLPEPLEAPSAGTATIPLFTTSLPGLETFPAVPTPLGLADRP